jgi:hypothetical protein
VAWLLATSSCFLLLSCLLVMIETSGYRPCCWKTPESTSSQGYTMNCVHRLRSARNVLLLGWARTARAVLLDRSPESSHASRWNKQLPSPFSSSWGPALPSTTFLSFQWCPRCCRFSLRRRFDGSRRRVTALRRRFDTTFQATILAAPVRWCKHFTLKECMSLGS